MAASRLAQDPPPKPDPVALVSQAEALLRKGDKEDAVMRLWRALDLLRGEDRNAVEEATWLSARFLLQENDPLEAARRAAFALVSTRQAAVAKSYRIKKWYETAADRLQVAGRYDPEPAAKERSVLAAKRKAAVRAEAKTAAPASTVDPLDRTLTVDVDGKWRNVDGELESLPHPGADVEGGGHWQWTTRFRHADHEVSFEFRAVDAKADYNLGLGLGVEGPGYVGGYRLVLQHSRGDDYAYLRILRLEGKQVLEVAKGDTKLVATKDGYHRFAATIRGSEIGLQLDGVEILKGAGTAAVRGHVGVMVGISGVTSAAIRYRNLLIGPLPTKQPSDEELRAKALAENQRLVTKSVDDAKQLMKARKPEAAAGKLRAGMLALDQLPEGVLHDNLKKSMELLLKKADPTARKRARAAQACEVALGELADRYLAAGQPRAARVLARQAQAFDPDQNGDRIAAIETAIDEWNAQQLLARSAELAPPKDDGSLLRKWFAGGSLLDSRGKAWIVQGPSARIENFARGRTMWMPKSEQLADGVASVHVHLPETGCQAGFVFDVAGPHDFGTAVISRAKNQMRLIVSRWAGGKWIDLANRPITMDTWKRGCWHQIELAVSKAGVKITSCGIEVPIARKRLGMPSARIGLYAGNYGDSEPTIELRAFRVEGH